MDKSTNNGVDILSIDAKDLYIANNFISSDKKFHIGYNIRFEKGENTGSINTKKFINTLDYSLELIKLREIYEKVYRNTNFTFMQNGHEYTTKVINVTFKYSNKEFNKIKKDTYVKFGYNINELVFTDHICLDNNELIAIEINQDVGTPISNDKLGKYFYFDNNQYHAKSIPTINSKCDLRKDLYKNGFYCDGIKYVRYKRSSGSSRVGKCLFVDEKLYSRMHKWEMCGIKIKEGQECDLAALEAYIALTLSSIIDTIEINPENILIIDDYESIFSDDVIETKLNGNWLESKENTMTIKNSIWDGQSLMDISLFGEYKNFGMLLLRNRFFKSCCFNTNIQKWFKDNKITDITQLNGYTIAKDIKDIKLITTPSSIKYLKFGSKEEWISNIEPLFGVVKHEKKTHNFDGRMVQTHYQLLNTLQLSEDEMVEFLKPSLDYLHLLKTDPSVVRYYIKYPENIKFEITPLVSKNDIVYKLLGLNDKFAKTKLYYDFKNDLTKSYVKNLRCGHVLVNGNYSTLLSCPIEMLQSAIFKFKGDSILGVGNIHSKNFEYNKQILCSRSPHVTIGNILVTNNISCDIVDEYCNLTKEIVCINTINENILERLSSADMDSDTMLMTDNDTLVKAALKNYSNFKVPTNNVESLKKNRKYTSVEKADLDFKTSDNKIGEIINLSQELNTLLWHEMNNGKEIPELQDLYNDICQLDVMSCIEIDKAKKEFIVNTYKEMQKIRDKWIENDDIGRKIKPNFFGHLAKTKGYYDSKKKNYKRHDTSMDYLQKIINQFQLSRLQKNNIAFEPFSTIINFDGYNTKNIKYDQVKRIVSLIKDTNTKIKSLYSSDEYDKDTKYKLFSEARQKCTEYIGKLSFSKSTMIYMLSLFDSNEYKHISRIFMNTLFGYPNTSFYRIIKESTEPIELLIENKEGNIKVFDMNFTKTYKN